MNLTSHVLAVILIVVCVSSAIMDFKKPADLLESMARLKVPSDRLAILAVIKIAAAAGLALGFVVGTLSLVTGVCLSVYFAIAVSTHVRAHDGAKNTLPAFAVLVLCMLFVLTTLAA